MFHFGSNGQSHPYLLNTHLVSLLLMLLSDQEIGDRILDLSPYSRLLQIQKCSEKLNIRWPGLVSAHLIYFVSVKAKTKLTYYKQKTISIVETQFYKERRVYYKSSPITQCLSAEFCLRGKQCHQQILRY